MSPGTHHPRRCRYDSFAALSPALKKQGYCVFGENLGSSNAILSDFPGVYLTGPVPDSANQLSQEVDKVLAATVAKEVNPVGWSQGGIGAAVGQNVRVGCTLRTPL